MSNDNKNRDLKFVVIRVRGPVRTPKKIKDTFTMLRLYRRNYCAIVDKKDIGMVQKVKDYATYGEIDPDTKKLLIEKRGEKTKDKDGKETIKKFFRLNSPKKGYGRRGIKRSFNKSGALGYRGNEINDLVRRML